jgi:hypothetical protein
MPGKPTLLPALVLLAGLLTGCYESSDVTVYEPGEYKGKSDPLLNQDSTQRAETLAKRFELVQTDR